MTRPLPQPVADPTDELAVLKAARELLDDPARWTRRTYWRDADGAECPDRGRVARCCALGALAYVEGAARSAGYSPSTAAATVSQRRFGTANNLLTALRGEHVSVVNDGPNGYRRILAAYDTAIATLEAERNAG